MVRDPGESGIEKVTFSLYLDSDTALYFYLKPNDGFSGDVTALIDGENVAEKVGDRYRVAVPDISAHLLGTEYTVDVNAGGNFQLKASAMSYVKLAFDAYTGTTDKDEHAQKAMTALYRYYAAAAAMKG